MISMSTPTSVQFDGRLRIISTNIIPYDKLYKNNEYSTRQIGGGISMRDVLLLHRGS